MTARIDVTLKKGVFDPQGEVLVNALHHLEYKDVEKVHVGKSFIIELSESDKDKARKQLEAMADTLFANPIIEDFKIEFLDS